MARVRKTVREGRFWHVRFRDPGRFETIRTPGWAQKVCASCSGYQVRMGRTEAGNWLVQSVLVPAEDGGRFYARRVARDVRFTIED